ncbi:hypothetical protein IEQ34_017118 [Dendrobium chrysotoxum]|uniref:Pentatricopeptide repeat-containing protein n=1 Tax=Dendrobium chrysotoxum TaxID=161865 RepID=A0AAV7GAM8_DENCH|nr:hypothetical protein IEQ34_017118 [Dendrobium chrysotoxum]
MYSDGLEKTLLGPLAACASSGALSIGRHIHGYAKEEKLEIQASLGTALVDMSEDALRLFDEMEESGVRPNEVTLLAVLSACSHGGLLGLGKDYFKRVVLEYRLCPGIKHYGCIIDLLGRAGFLQEAYELVKSLPYGGDALAWRALLAASRVHGEIRIGKLARETLAALGEEHPTNSILLSSSYAYAGRWEEIRKVMDLELVGLKDVTEVEFGPRDLVTPTRYFPQSKSEEGGGSGSNFGQMASLREEFRSFRDNQMREFGSFRDEMR